MCKRIIVTGGSGKAGQHIISYLLDQGHDILNLDLVPLPAPLSDRVYTMRVDLTDAGQVYSAFGSHFHLTEPFREPLGAVPDAVVHMAGFARNMLVPDTENFRCNASSQYNVIEAAHRMNIKKVVLASSVSVYGVAYAEGDIGYDSFPVDEEVDANPMDTYAISKIVGERVARGFARRYGSDIYVLRIGRIVAPEEYKEEMFEDYVKKPENWSVHGWAYMDTRDLGQICDLAVKKDGLGFQIFNAVNDEITNYTSSSAEFLKGLLSGVPFTREMGPREAPISNKKARELLGFRQNHPWQKYYEA